MFVLELDASTGRQLLTSDLAHVTLSNKFLIVL